MKVFSSFTEAYWRMLFDVYRSPDFEPSPRGQKIREKIGYSFKITNPRNRLPYLKGRDYHVSYFVAESLWYLLGNDSIDWIANYSSFWRNISDDGQTANSAYGARIFKPHDRVASTLSKEWTQWDYVIDELVKDPDSRRAVIHIRSPQDSLLASKDVPCTLTLQFFLREDKIHMVVSMRSSDLILGMAYDVPAFTLFQELLANQLSARLNKQIGLGEYTHTSNSLHIYQRHFDMVESIILEGSPLNPVEMPPMPTDNVPLNDLLEFERHCRISNSQDDLYDVLWRLKGNDLHTYWYDWALILASHRAGKLEQDLKSFSQKKLIQNTSFEGYRFFDK